jgi:hypothetical protein
VPVYPGGHPSPRNLSDLLAGVFQSCWVSPDFDAAIAQLERLGMEFPIRFEPEVDFVVGSRTEHVSLKAALGTAADGALAVEVLQPVDDPTGVFTSLLDGSSGGARFHHCDRYSPLREVHRERQANRTGPHHENACLHHVARCLVACCAGTIMHN